jgi:isopentenyl-diphosphate delta-isomerase
VGLVREQLRPDPGEIGETAFVTPVDLEELQETGPFSAWFPTVLEAAMPAIRELTADAGW